MHRLKSHPILSEAFHTESRFDFPTRISVFVHAKGKYPRSLDFDSFIVLVPVVLIKSYARGMCANTRRHRAKIFPLEGVVDGRIEFLSPTMFLT